MTPEEAVKERSGLSDLDPKLLQAHCGTQVRKIWSLARLRMSNRERS